MTTPTDRPLRLATIVASTRTRRFGGAIAEWFARQVEARPELAHDVIDLAEVGLPAILPTGRDRNVESLSARLDAADAITIVVPEYNHSYPASIKQAIDVSGDEWEAKPVAFVSYGGLSGGLRAVEHLRPVLSELRTTTVRNTVSFHGASASFGPDGELLDPEGVGVAAKALLDELVWWAEALRDARDARPFPG